MPHYEFFCILRRMSKNDTAACLKRTAEMILDNNGILRKIENLGTRQMPRKLKDHVPGRPNHKSGSYFLFHFDLPPAKMDYLKERVLVDNDFLWRGFIKKELKIPKEYKCTLEDELKPPVFREPVKRLIEESRKWKEDHMPRPFEMGTKLKL